MAVLQVAPTTDRGLAEWSFCHAEHHRDLVRRVGELRGIVLPEYVLDPFNFSSLGGVLRTHQLMHGALNAIIGLASSDLLEVDFTNPQQREAWTYLNYKEHLSYNQVVGV